MNRLAENLPCLLKSSLPGLLFLFLFAPAGQAQFVNKLGKKLGAELHKKGENPPTASAAQPASPADAGNQQDPPGKAAYKSKFDFIPGEEVYSYYDFSELSPGDVPEGWQIDGSAEVVEVDGYSGHYLMLNDHSAIIPETFNDLSEDLTIQFDLVCTDPFAWGSNQLYFALANTDPNKIPKGLEDHLGSVNNSVFWVSFHPGSQSAAANKGHGEYKLRTKSGITQGSFACEAFTDKGEGRLAKISIWRQKRRVRVYVNENKVLDLSTILPQGMAVNTFAWSAYSYYNDNKYFIGNIRIAKGLPDSRKNLLQNGKYVTTGIFFNVNSAEIKPESYGLLKELAGSLKAAAGKKVTITGYTDSDGGAEANLELSKRRAEAVKKALVRDYSLNADLISTDGKGASDPVAPNDSPQNKAKNRRVEFVLSGS